eukprot:TRINITY_DN21495_c0_g1_i1.p1 TRINITY_DN21495_c0_g1~~TRINITY_DN21495_c0_g1_i1.p1  ORF type:complete len:468 (+),score=89.72 TRINITY_DN21495_c0_g1_i1:31-1404(+)
MGNSGTLPQITCCTSYEQGDHEVVTSEYRRPLHAVPTLVPMWLEDAEARQRQMDRAQEVPECITNVHATAAPDDEMTLAEITASEDKLSNAADTASEASLKVTQTRAMTEASEEKAFDSAGDMTDRANDAQVVATVPSSKPAYQIVVKEPGGDSKTVAVVDVADGLLSPGGKEEQAQLIPLAEKTSRQKAVVAKVPSAKKNAKKKAWDNAFADSPAEMVKPEAGFGAFQIFVKEPGGASKKVVPADYDSGSTSDTPQNVSEEKPSGKAKMPTAKKHARQMALGGKLLRPKPSQHDCQTIVQNPSDTSKKDAVTDPQDSERCTEGLPQDVNEWTQLQMNDVCKEAISATKGQVSILYTMDKGYLTVKAHFAQPQFERFATRCYDFKFARGAGLPGLSFQSGSPKLMSDVTHAQFAIFPRKDFALAFGLVSFMCKPVGSNAVLEVVSERPWKTLPAYMK